MHVSKISRNANIIVSHTLFKIKENDCGQLYLKCRIVPDGNFDAQKKGLRTDSPVCLPTGMRIVCSLATIQKWYLTKIDFQSAFLQSGSATRDVYVLPPNECQHRRAFYWLLLTATYGLVNANVKWQLAIDDTLQKLGLIQLRQFPQLFAKYKKNELVLVAAKVVDDVLIAGIDQEKKDVLTNIQKNTS